MDIKKLLEDLKKCESLEERHRCLLKYGFRLDDINDEYSGSVEMCYGNEDGYCAGIMIFPEEDCLYMEDGDDEDNEVHDEFMTSCNWKDWDEIEDHTIESYVWVWDEDGNDLIGYKDFGISDKEFNDLSGRYREQNDFLLLPDISENVCEKRLAYRWYGSLFWFIFTKITTKKRRKIY